MRRASYLVFVFAAGCGGLEEGRDLPWTPGDDEGTGRPDLDAHDTEGSGPDSGAPTSGDGEVCEPGEIGDCLCDDGLSLGTQECEDDGSAWGDCLCDDGDEGGGSTTDDPGDGDGGDETTGGDETVTEVCYPGSDLTYTTCFDLYFPDSPPDGYEYPPALGGDPNYRAPIAYLDLQSAPEDTWVAPNFQLGELAQLYKGRWAVVQPHAVERLQDLREAVGAITVNSGYRSPDYNASVDGAEHSRHMYGDGFDLDPLEVGLETLEAECTDIGGMLVEYSTHVHCDFRFDAVDEGFFGSAGQAPPREPTAMATAIDHVDGVFTATAQGFDEGEPTRRWVAYDAEGAVLLRALTPVFIAPAGTARVEVDVGRRVSAAVELGR